MVINLEKVQHKPEIKNVPFQIKSCASALQLTPFKRCDFYSAGIWLLSPVCVAIFSFTAAQRGADEYLQTRRCLQCKLQMAVKICWWSKQPKQGFCQPVGGCTFFPNYLMLLDGRDWGLGNSFLSDWPQLPATTHQPVREYTCFPRDFCLPADF